MSVFPGSNNYLGEASEQALVWFQSDIHKRTQEEHEARKGHEPHGDAKTHNPSCSHLNVHYEYH